MSIMLLYRVQYGGIEFYFDKKNANIFLETIKNIENRGSHVEEAVNLNSEKTTTLRFTLKDADEIYMRKNSIDINISKDAIDYATYKINEFLKTGEFYPAEFYEFSNMKKRKGNISIYFLKIYTLDE